MTKIGIGLPGQSIADIRNSAEAAAPYAFDSFSVYGDLGDLPPYAVLHASADVFRDSSIAHIGPMGVPVGLQHPQLVGVHSVALEEQLPGQTYVRLVRGAFLDQIGQKPATLGQLTEAIEAVRVIHAARGLEIPIYVGGFGPKLLALAGVLAVDGVKLGGTTNPLLAEKARKAIANDGVSIVMGAVSVIDQDRKAARELARREVAKYLDVVGGFDPTLNEDEQASLRLFRRRFPTEPDAYTSISDGLLDKFALAGTPEDVIARLAAMQSVDRFELGTPHGLSDRPTAIRYIGETIIRELGDTK